MNHITVNYDNKPAYNIVIEKDYNSLISALKPLQMEQRKFMIISESTVSKFYLEECINIFNSIGSQVSSFIFPAGESSKNLSTVNDCYEQLILHNFDRNDVLVALGGGVVGDLTGFVAATYLRGVRFIQLPTSLLSMVDSSIGGKTGVDYKAYKNMVGAFHQPKLVYMNLSTLLTLKDREFYSGMGEIIKHGLIKDASYYHWLKENHVSIKVKDFKVLKDMIERSCLIKKEVVEIDPKELGIRATLNYGHTIGHAIEKLKDLTLLHGECVAIGMAAASYLSLKRNYITTEEYNDILDTIKNFELPITTNQLSATEVYDVTRLDKKVDAVKIKFILLEQLGRAMIDTSVTKEEMIKAIETVIK